MKRSPLALKELQHWMKWIITDPRGVTEALAEPKPKNLKFIERYTEPEVSAREFIHASGTAVIEERLSVYAEGYFSRILESLESDFERVRLVLGEFRFQKLIVEYLKAFPSNTGNIGEVGKHLASFIAEFEELKEFHFLSDLASFEWKMIEVFYALESKRFNPEAINEIADDAWEKLQITFDLSVSPFESYWPIDRFWEMTDQPSAPKGFLRSSTAEPFLLWRKDGVVHFKKSTPIETELISKFRQGKSLEDCLNSLTSLEAPQVMSYFGSWVTDGMISELIIPQPIKNNDEQQEGGNL